MTRIVTLVLGIFLILGGTVAFAAGPGDAQAPAAKTPAAAAKTPTAMTVAALPQPDGTVTVTAKVTKVGGGAIGNQSVDFFVQADFFGKRPVPAGTAVTDSTGTAAIRYEPSWAGATEFSASYAGTAAYAGIEGSLKTAIEGVNRHYHQEPAPMADFRRKAAYGALGLATGTMLFLAFVLLRVVWAASRRGEGVPVGDEAAAAGTGAQ